MMDSSAKLAVETLERDFCSVVEASAKLNRSHPAVFDLIKAGKLDSVKFGRYRAVYVPDVDALLAETDAKGRPIYGPLGR